MLINYSRQSYSHKVNQRDKTTILNKSTFILKSGRELKDLINFIINIKYIILKKIYYESKFYRSRMMDRDHLDLIKISKDNLFMKIINLYMLTTHDFQLIKYGFTHALSNLLKLSVNN